MRELELDIIKPLRQGLYSDPGNPTNGEFLQTCYNLKPSPLGIVPYKPIQVGFSTDMDWPFPKLMIGMSQIVLGTRSEFYVVNDNWSIVKRADVTGSSFWTLADFDAYFIASNGSQLVVNEEGAWHVYTATSPSTSFPTAGTVCNFKGQLILGNIKSDFYDCGERSVVWSDIGSVNCTPGIKNVAGYRNVPWYGKVHLVQRLGNSVVVYGDSGIGALVPYEQTFGWKDIKEGGIKWLGAAGGTDKKHLFLDNDDQLWLMGEDLAPKLLNYKDQMTDLTDPIVTYNGAVDEFMISDADVCYVLTKYGLGGCHQPVTSVGFKDGIAYGLVNDLSDESVLLVTNTYDFGIRGMKTVGFIECDGALSNDLYLAVDYRYDRGGSFTRSPWVYAGKEGVAYIGVSAVDFRICLKFTVEAATTLETEDGFGLTLEDGTPIQLEGAGDNNYEQFCISKLNVKVKMSDKRFVVRGPYRRDLGNVVKATT